MIFARMIPNQEASIPVKNQDESRTNDHEGGLQFVAHILQNKRRSFCHNQDLSRALEQPW